MKIGQKGFDLIKEFEGCRLEAYLDAIGIPTIAYGHTGGVKLCDKVTQEEADELLHGDLLNAEECVTKWVKVRILQEEFDALVSLVFNIGCGNFRTSTLLKLLNVCDFNGAADQFLVWNKAGQKTLPGLVRRREAERKLFLE